MYPKNTTPLQKKGEQHSLEKSLLLHLLPGFVFTLIFITGVRVTTGWGVPPFFVFLIVGLLFLIPFELGYLLHLAKKRNKTFSLRGIVVFREKMPGWQHVVLAVLLLGWAYFIALAINRPIEPVVVKTFFSWVPDQYRSMVLANQLEQYSRPILMATAFLGILFNGIIGPIVEELYFRGFLLPRISRFGRWAPFLNSVLFSVYHFFTPWQIPLRILALTPLFYTVWWKKNIFLGMIVHCLMNLIGSSMFLIQVL